MTDPSTSRRRPRWATPVLALAALVTAWATAATPTVARAAAPGARCELSEARRVELLEQCVGRTAVAVRLESCPRTICLDAERNRELISLTGLDDLPLSAEAIDRGVDRLMKTGFFQGVVPRCTPEGGGVRLTLDVCPNTFVHEVEVEGNSHFHDSDIKKRIFLRPGTILNVDPKHPLENEDVQRQIASIERLYLKEGLRLTAQPRVEVTRVDATALDLLFVVSEGPRQRVRELSARHLIKKPAPPGKPRCPTVTSRAITQHVDVSVGDVVTERRRKRMEQELAQWFRSLGFVAPEPRVIVGGRPLKLDITVATRDCWQLRVWERDAATAGASSEPSFRFRDPVGQPARSGPEAAFKLAEFEPWRKVLPFGESGVFESDEAARGVDAIHRVLESQGFLFADVVLEHRRTAPRGGEEPVQGVIDYYVTRNYERRVQEILFDGAKSFERDTLLEVIKTSTYSFFDVGGHLEVDKVLVDLKALREFYVSRGFYDFRFEVTGTPSDPAPRRSFRREGGWLIWEYTFRNRGFRVKKREAELAIYLEIPFTEGPRTRVGQLALLPAGDAAKKPRLRGETGLRLSEREARELMSLAPGKPYGTRQLARDLREVEEWYRARGYHAVSISVTCEAHDPAPPDGLCDPQRVAAKEVDLVFRITEGRPVVVGEIFWRGNYRSDADILVRDLPETGKPFNRADVIEATRRMRNLGVFNSVRVDTIGLEEDPPRSKVAMVVVVEEAPSRFIDLAAGFRKIDRANLGTVPPLMGSILGQSVAAVDRVTTGHARPFSLLIPDILVVGEIEYIDQNFRGRAEELRVPVEYGFTTRSPIALARLSPTWTIPTRILDLDLRIEWAIRLILTDRVTEVKDFTEFSTGLTFSLPILRRMSLAVEASGGVIRFEEPDTEQHLLPWEGDYEPFIRASLRWRWDEQDNPLHPTRGFALTTSVSAIRATELENDLAKARNFVKWEASARAALSAADLIIAGFFRYGGSDADELHPLPTKERYTLGGSNGMRGFADNAVGRYARDGQLMRPREGGRLDAGGNVLINASLELRFPVLQTAGIWGVVFTDAGALAAEHEEVYPESFRVSFGLGVRYLLGNQIPFRLDIGFPVAPRCQRYYLDDAVKPENRYDCLVFEESWAVHFGFLYPF